DALAAAADAAMSEDESGPGRRQSDARFASVLSEADTIAATTSFNGVALLRGGSGPGGVLEIPLRVSGNPGDASEITIVIPPARIANLSPGLARGSIASGEGARVVRGNIAAAMRSVGAIRDGIAADRRRVAAAYRNARTFGRMGESLPGPTS